MRFLAFAAVMFFGVWGRSQTPSRYPYFNKINNVSNSLNPNFWNYYGGGVLLNNATLLLLGMQYEGANNTYQRTLEFIDLNTGNILDKKIEPNFPIIGLQNPPFSGSYVDSSFYDLGTQGNVQQNGFVRTLRKYADVYQVPIAEYELDSYPTVIDADFYRAFTTQENGQFLCYGSAANGQALMTIFDTNATLVHSTDFSNITQYIGTNYGTIQKASQLLDNSYIVEFVKFINSSESIEWILMLNEDFSWKKSLMFLNGQSSGQFLQSADSSIYCFGFKDSTNNLGSILYPSFISKFTNNGDFLWEKSYPISQINTQLNFKSSILEHALELSSGNLVFIGTNIFKGTDGDYQQIDGEQSLQTRLLCVNANGDKIWERSIFTSNENSTITHGHILLPKDDIILFGGIREDFFFGQKAFVAKVNCLGRMTDVVHNVQTNEQDGLVSVQIEADSFFETTIDWGDGTPSTTFQTSYSDSSELFFVQHQYVQSKPYQMTVSTIGCKDTLVYELVQEAHVPDNNEAELSMYPNPTFHSFTIHLPTNELLDIQITDEFGRLVANYKQVSAFTGFEVDLNSELAGKYHVKIIGKSRSWLGKIIKL
jgi:hypothetical protein